MRWLMSLLVLLLAAVTASAETWPTRPIRVIIPAGAGSAVDVIPRVVFDQVSAQLGQAIIVDNRPGAGSTLGTAAVARAEPDGYTLLANSSAHAITPSVYATLPYDAVRDFAAVIPLGIGPNVLIVNSSRGFKTIDDLVRAAKSRPGALNYASVGVGSATHMSAERFRLSAGIDVLHIPFKGGPEALSEILAGRIEFYFCPLGTALPLIRDGRLTALAVNTRKRAAALPEVPTTIEAGFPDSDYAFWIGLFAPAKTPQSVIDRLYQETDKALQTPALLERLAQLGFEPLHMNPAEFNTFVANEIRGNAPLVKAAGIKPN